MTAKTLAFLALCAVLAWAAPARAADSYDNCTGFITALPADIGPGTWCLNKNLVASVAGATAINIVGDDATLDCKGFAIDGSSQGAGTGASGIVAQDHRNATIRHCTIRGFYQGLWLTGERSRGHRIEDNRFDRNTYMAAWVGGDGSVVQRNRVFHTGGSTVYCCAVGIQASGVVTVRDNVVADVHATVGSGGFAWGIVSQGGGLIRDNRVRGVKADGAGTERGIFAFDLDRLLLSGNLVVGGSRAGSIGLECQNGTGNDRATRNTILGFEAAIAGCGAGPGNDTMP